MLKKQLNSPDLLASLMAFGMLFVAVRLLLFTGAAIFELIVFILLGSIFGLGAVLKEINWRKARTVAVPQAKRGETIFRALLIFMMAVEFTIIFVPLFVKFWVYALLAGFFGTIAALLIVKEVRENKRYGMDEI
ncbi:MAG: hypothetical protein HGA23_11095 [Bacteroidales bacterium]|nr:hypothetical protein [Bacteroidales bacterium]